MSVHEGQKRSYGKIAPKNCPQYKDIYFRDFDEKARGGEAVFGGISTAAEPLCLKNKAARAVGADG